LDSQKKCVRAQEQNEAARTQWQQQIQKLDARQLVFLDECGVNTTMHRRYGRAPKGQRALGVVPRNWKSSTTILGALSCEGVQAVMSLEGATDRLAFEAFIEQVVLPTLRPGQVVVLDNLSAHKSHKAQQLVEEAGCSWLFLPPYSPDFNPIEMLWSKFKSDLRREAPRSQHTLDDLIWPLLSTATSKHAQNWFQHAGYHLMPPH
jgi:transposase